MTLKTLLDRYSRFLIALRTILDLASDGEDGPGNEHASREFAAALADLRVPANEIEVLEAAVHDNASDKEGAVTRWLKSVGCEIATIIVQ